MPGIAQKINVCAGSNGTVYHNSLVGNGPLPYHSFNGSSVSNSGFWSKHRDDMSYNQLQKFWCELTTQARHTLMRIDKQTLFEHARKNMYCSRCNGLLLEGFLQIVMYGKSLQQDATSGHYRGRTTNNQNCGNLCIDNECQDDVIDPSLHPWGGLTTARDGVLTLLDCYLHSKSLKGLQNVFDSARARERERKLLYPDACGGGGRGWISQGMTGYGRGHGTRETCALHTARLSVETLIDFWSALGEETRQSLLKMKEEDFIERLMYRFDSKRFCRDCRRNVIREFKELKDLKRMRKDPLCTSWFCVADSAFQYEVSHDTVQADWHQTFLDACGTYHHFEWAIGTGEGKSDILDFKSVGLSVRVRVNGLDLSGLSACYITLRAWKMDGRCNELCVKAHAMQGQRCVHCRLAVGDGYATISIGENIRRFFEHAEEAEEEEDDDSMDKDGNELDGECSRPQKHAKSPELAREFLLDAATVIFKEQVEKAFREGTARQNAHSIFVSLALKLLEERVHVACKEIITLEKQMKLLEEEEKEKREEEERKERRRTKEREKKLRRKERLREKENKEKKCAESNRDDVVLDTRNEAKPCVDEGIKIGKTGGCAREMGEATPPDSPLSLDIQDDQFLMGYSSPNMDHHPEDIANGESGKTRDFNTSLPYTHYRYSRRKSRLYKDTEQDFTSKWSDRRKGVALSESELTISKYESRFHADGFESTRSINCFNKQLRTSATKFNTRNGPKASERLRCTNNRLGDRCDSLVCSCNLHNDYRARPESLIMRSAQEPKYVNKLESSCDIVKSYYRGKCTQVECTREINGRVKTNSPVTKQVWEPLDSQKKCVQSNSGYVALKPKVDTTESDRVHESSGIATSSVSTDVSVETHNKDNELRDLTRSGDEPCTDTENGFHAREKSENYIKVEEAEDGELCFMARSPQRTVDSLLRSSSNSDNCSSCLSEGDSNTSSSNGQNLESTSTSDSEESSQTSEGRHVLHCLESRFAERHKVVDDRSTTRRQDANSQEPASGAANSSCSLPEVTSIYCESRKANAGVNAQPQSALPAMMHNQSIQYPIYQAPTMGYYRQSSVSWPAGPTDGLMPFHYSNHYLFANTNSFGYDLNTNAQLMQYGGLQLHHLPPPLINPVHMPVLPPVTQGNVVYPKDHATAPSPPGVVVKEVIHHGIQTREGHSAGQTDEGNNDFSLFHFGGPVALSTRFKAEAGAALKEGAAGDGNGNGNHPCNRKDSIEEYNLFAASNGIKFSIF
ncbi:hypothetical protein C2S53_016036 [Perilla frutescens var. hirtella]|uniref:Stress response protein nst1 n=1 Tax=Perilla frutescens var. hirtella TaxID=608512 RepID=A0AAD4P5B1_PERFH|nr:hypothetical protein C2S53_016036 [Perilla frutescens var. hirtella]